MVSMDTRREGSFRTPDIKLFVRDVRDQQGKKRRITVRSWSTVKDVKDEIQRAINVPPCRQRLYYGPLLTSSGDLPNHRSLHDAGIYRSGETLLLDIVGNTESSSSITALGLSNDVCISPSMVDLAPKALKSIVQAARNGFAMGFKPEFVLDGSGGTYFLRNTGKSNVAVFKPADEEPYAENNPRGYLQAPGQSLSLREGIVPGESCIREVAAYLLDHDGFASVPMTTLAEARHPAFNANGSRLKVSEGGACVGSHSMLSPSKAQSMKKVGSLQEYVDCECTMDDISPSMIPVEEIHKIAILDIRTMNSDRNTANLLVRTLEDGRKELVPIDHGYCLRSVGDVSWMDWCWLDWPQLKKPLSKEHKKYVMDLDIEADVRLLRERLNICDDAVDYFRASSSLLKAGVKAGLTLYDIAVLCCRNDNLAEEPSTLERFFSMAKELAQISMQNKRWHHSAASRALVEQLTPQRQFKFDTSIKGFGGNMRKSVSTAEFLPSRKDLLNSTAEFILSGRDSPSMAQSSGSDSSLGEGESDVDKEECDEWAANIIDKAVDRMLLFAPAKRSTSIGSDDASNDSCLSRSPKGFWHVRPGTSPSNGSDDGSVSWSPHINRELVDFSSASELPKVLGGRAEDMSRMSTSILPNIPLLPPSTVSFTKLDGEPEAAAKRVSFRRQTSLARSNSYSAWSGSMDASVDDISATKCRPQPFSEDYDHYRGHFQKFVDLFIVRETTAAAQQIKSMT